MKEKLLRDLETKREFSLKETLEHANRLIPHFVEKQRRYKVADLVNKRTVRFYMKEGLIDKPAYYRGRYAVFSYDHVLKILVIKRLQSAYIPLKKIAEITRGLKTEALKRILLDRQLMEPSGVAVSTDIVELGQERTDSAALWKSDLYETGASLTDLSGGSWKRYRIHEKLELNIEERFDILGKDVDIQEIISRIMKVLAREGHDLRAKCDKGIEDIGFDYLDIDYCKAAQPMKNRSHAVIALITEGGLVPKGNPDQLESARASGFYRYSIEGIVDLKAEEFESIDRGWNNSHVNEDPDRLLPLDIMRELEKKRIFSAVYQYFYTTTGAGTPISQAKKMGRRIARELKEAGVSGVIFTST